MGSILGDMHIPDNYQQLSTVKNLVQNWEPPRAPRFAPGFSLCVTVGNCRVGDLHVPQNGAHKA